MDIQLEQKKNSNYKLTVKVLAVILALIAVVFYAAQAKKLDLSKIVTAQVEYGSVDVSANGIGTLISLDEYLVTASESGIIKKIEKKAGEIVENDHVLIIIENNDVYEYKNKIAAEIESQRLLNLKAKLTRDNELLQIQDQVNQARRIFKRNQNKVENTIEIAAKGVISKFKFNQYLHAAEDAESEVKNLELKYSRLKKINEAKQNVDDNLLRIKENELKEANLRVKKLEIRTNLAGIVKDMNLKVGDYINKGEKVAVVSGIKPNAAKVKFPQHMSSSIKVGMEVNITTFSEAISGNISRIEPDVKDGYFSTEIVLLDTQEYEAKAGAKINATILIDRFDNTLYVNKPIDVSSKIGIATVEVIKGDEIIAREINVLGITNKHLVISHGVAVGENIIIAREK